MKTQNFFSTTTNPNTLAGHLRTNCAAGLLPLLLLLVLPAAVQAQFAYTTNNGTITITGYTGPGGAVSIPSTINGLSVTSIGFKAFWSCTSLTSVTIPNSVTSIGDGAFSMCTSLSAIAVSAFNSFYSSVDWVLFDKNQTRLIQYPGGKAGSYTIPNSVTSIGDRAFSLCSNLPSVTIPNSVTNIGRWAFAYCTNLSAITVDASNSFYSSVAGVLFNKSTNTLIQCPGGKAGTYTIPNSVAGIGDSAFSFCTSLTSVTIPDNVTGIGSQAFAYCTNLSAIMVGAQNFFYSSVDGVLLDKSQTMLIQCPGGKTGTYTIPNGVTSIGDSAFYGCTRLTSITIGNSVTNIEYFAFDSCTSLASVTIPTSVTRIADGAFYDCRSLTSVMLPNSVTVIGGQAFNGCTSLTSITIPNGVTVIWGQAFGRCTSLTGIYFQGNAPYADSSVFYGASNTTVYYLPGKTGWPGVPDAWAGRPTALWLPLAQTGDASFGVRTNQFGFNIAWASGVTVVIEACTNLANHLWQPVKTNTLTEGSSYYSDPDWTNYPGRFYRLRSP